MAHPGCYLGGGLSIYRVEGAGSGVGGGQSYKSCRLGRALASAVAVNPLLAGLYY